MKIDLHTLVDNLEIVWKPIHFFSDSNNENCVLSPKNCSTEMRNWLTELYHVIWMFEV